MVQIYAQHLTLETGTEDTGMSLRTPMITPSPRNQFTSSTTSIILENCIITIII